VIDANEELGLEADEDAALRAFEAEAGEVFPQLGDARPGDEALVARLTEQTIAAGPAAAGTAVVGAKTIAIAAAVLGAGLVAIVSMRGAPQADTPSTPAVAPAPAVEPSPPSTPEPTPEPAAPTTVAPVPADDPPAIDRELESRRPRARAPEPAPEPGIDAATLLREGNAARRAGDHARARETYRRIRKEFPGTREDMLVRVSLGQLALDHFSDPTDALVQFGTYLRDNPHGTLAEEASLGRIAALRRLGRRDAERAMLQGFLADFPESIQRQTVAKRLAELDR